MKDDTKTFGLNAKNRNGNFLEKLEMCKLNIFFKKNQIIIQSIISVSVCINV